MYTEDGFSKGVTGDFVDESDICLEALTDFEDEVWL